MLDAIYFPIHRAKKGEITSVGHLKPHTLTRVRPTFEIQKPGQESEVELSEYLAGIATALSSAWDHRLPLFADLPMFGPDDITQDGKHCVEYLFRCLRQLGLLAIPMTGPVTARGPGYAYLEAVAVVAQLGGLGAAIRLLSDEFNDRGKISNALDDTMRVLGLTPPSIDLFLDLEAIAFLSEQYRTAEGLAALLMEPLQHVVPMGFRNIVICGSCIPENVDKRYNGRPMRVERTDLKAWQILLDMFHDVVIKRGDTGVTYALEQDVDGPVRPPARIRITTPTEYLLWRAPRREYLSLSERVAKSPEFDVNLDAWGATEIRQCAQLGRGRGGPTEWVARDTNLSTEVTVRAMESYLQRIGRSSKLQFAETETFPWNQSLIGAR